MDVGDFASTDMAHYQRVGATLAERGTPLPGPLGPDRAAMLAGINARYLTGGTASLAELADGSVDLAWSISVIEHVRRAEMPRFLAELYRVTAPGGMGWHSIDLMDHLGGGMANLRFGEALWEAPWFAARSGFYTNRLRAGELVALARAAGFRTRIAWRQWWPTLPLPKARMAPHFRAMPEDVLLEKPAPADDTGPRGRP
jgi:SAM-dependent methyltransferase